MFIDLPMCGEGSKKMRFVVLLWGVLSNYAKDKEDYANCQSYFYIASQHYWLGCFNKGGGFGVFSLKICKALDCQSFNTLITFVSLVYYLNISYQFILSSNIYDGTLFILIFEPEHGQTSEVQTNQLKCCQSGNERERFHRIFMTNSCRGISQRVVQHQLNQLY